MAQPPLRIELPSRPLAESLRNSLRPFEVETVPVRGHYEVLVHLHDLNPEQRVVDALSGIDAWLAAAGLDAVRVHLDGSSYTLHAPPLP